MEEEAEVDPVEPNIQGREAEDKGEDTDEVSEQCSPVGVVRSSGCKHEAASREELGANCPAVRGLRMRGLEGLLSRTEIPSGVARRW